MGDYTPAHVYTAADPPSWQPPDEEAWNYFIEKSEEPQVPPVSPDAAPVAAVDDDTATTAAVIREM